MKGMVSFTKDMKTVYYSANNYIKKKKNKNSKKGTSYIQLFMASVTKQENGQIRNYFRLTV